MAQHRRKKVGPPRGRPRAEQGGASEQGGRRGRGTRPSRRPARPGPFRSNPPAVRRSSQPGDDDAAPGQGERLQKVLAAAGIGSRRQCEELITTGRIEVDRQVVAQLGVRVDPLQQEIRVDGQALPRPQRVYYAVNKPDGVVSTNRDPAGRPRVIDLVPESAARLFAVGRLDLHSEGLILVTNDGALAHHLTHPRFEIPKTYRVQVAGEPSDEVLDKLRQGIHLAEGIARADKVTVLHRRGKSSVLEIVLSEGKNREIRRILARVGHKVLRLLRTAVGPIRLGRLPPGESRRLTPAEIDTLWQLVRAHQP